MKSIFSVLLTLAISTSSFAAINMPHFMNKIAGDYSYDASSGTYGGKVNFKVTNKGIVTMDKNSEESFFNEGKVSIANLKNEAGPDGLPVATVILQGGSDEQTATILIRLSMSQDGDTTELLLIDVLETENDGPNTVASLSLVKAGTLLKKDKAGKLVKVNKL